MMNKQKNVQLVCKTFKWILTSSTSSVAMAFGSLDSLDSSEADILVFKRKSTIKKFRFCDVLVIKIIPAAESKIVLRL